MFEHHVDVHALAGDVPDGLAEFARLFEPHGVFRSVHGGHLPPAIKVATVDNALGAEPHDKLTLVFVGNHTDGVGAGRVDQLDRVGAKAAGCAPYQNVLTRLQVVGLMAKQHTVSGCERERIARAFFPRQVLGAWHQLLCLYPREL